MFFNVILEQGAQGQRSWYSDSLQAGSNPCEREIFCNCPDLVSGKWMPTLAPGINRPGRRVNRPPPSSADVKETPLSLHGLLYGEIYLYFYLYQKIGSDRFFG